MGCPICLKMKSQAYASELDADIESASILSLYKVNGTYKQFSGLIEFSP